LQARYVQVQGARYTWVDKLLWFSTIRCATFYLVPSTRSLYLRQLLYPGEEGKRTYWEKKKEEEEEQSSKQKAYSELGENKNNKNVNSHYRMLSSVFFRAPYFF